MTICALTFSLSLLSAVCVGHFAVARPLLSSLFFVIKLRLARTARESASVVDEFLKRTHKRLAGLESEAEHSDEEA